MVLDSNVDPRHVWYAANLNQDVAFDRNINIWFGWLAKHNAAYHLGATQKAVHDLWYAQLAALAKKPAGGIIGPDEWTDAFLGAGYYQQTWTDLADVFSQWVHQHDLAPLRFAYESQDTPGDDNGYAVYDAVQCSDVQWPQSWARWAEGQLGGLPEGPVRDLGERLVQRALPVLAGQARHAGEGRRQQGRAAAC